MGNIDGLSHVLIIVALITVTEISELKNNKNLISRGKR